VRSSDSLVLDGDRELARRVLSAEPGAEDELIRRFQPGLFAIACVRVGRDLAGDLVQDTLAAGLVDLRRGRWRGEGPLAAYLATVLRRKIGRDAAARRSRPLGSGEEELASTGADAHALVERAERRERVRAAVAQLPARHALVLVLHYFENTSVEEIAGKLAIPRGTVLSRLHHARAKLAGILNRTGAGRHSLRGAGEG
jgi:RNA polymerase sigma factor (sigma-70 family)